MITDLCPSAANVQSWVFFPSKSQLNQALTQITVVVGNRTEIERLIENLYGFITDSEMTNFVLWSEMPSESHDHQSKEDDL
jgi:hypothetical protein